MGPLSVEVITADGVNKVWQLEQDQRDPQTNPEGHFRLPQFAMLLTTITTSKSLHGIILCLDSI